MNRYEHAIIVGFTRMGATCCQIMEVFWYLSKDDIMEVIKLYKQ